MLRHKFYGNRTGGFDFKMTKRKFNNSKKRGVITHHQPVRPSERRPVNTRIEPRNPFEEETLDDIDHYTGSTFDQISNIRSELVNINNRLNRKDDNFFNNSRQPSRHHYFDSYENPARTRPSTKGLIKGELEPVDHEKAKQKLKLLLEKQLQKAKGKRKRELQRRLAEIDRREVSLGHDASSDYNYSKIMKLSGLAKLDHSIHSRVRNLKQNNSEIRGNINQVKDRILETSQYRSSPKANNTMIVTRNNTSKKPVLKDRIFQKKISCDYRDKKKTQFKKGIIIIQRNKMMTSKIPRENDKELKLSGLRLKSRPIKRKIMAKWKSFTQKLLRRNRYKHCKKRGSYLNASRSYKGKIIDSGIPLPISPSPRRFLKENKTLIIDDLEEPENDLHETVDHIKNYLHKFQIKSKIEENYSKIKKSKSIILACMKGYRERKYVKKLRIAAHTIIKHYKTYKIAVKSKMAAKTPPPRKIKSPSLTPKSPSPTAQVEESPATMKRKRQLEFIRKQREITVMKKKRKEAVRIFEKYYCKKLIRRKYREFRKKLAKIPKEMRIVYFKYMALRADTNVLVSEFHRDLGEPKGVMSPTNFLID
ncbi:unnamed protein product [Moneuplotes crassus]|uniref:Uncharacterized protein n=1 Tax=Euplotes crassus TaxID=5936 RepID=A0AAD1X9B4_EUPCR|nr:unnamed protein product [Moneuplotes crassus]